LKLTIITHIYNNQEALRTQIQEWNSWPVALGTFELIFIDDGSYPELDLENIPPWVKCYKILDDIPWNQPGAKNLGAQEALGQWLLFYDADQLIKKEEISNLLQSIDQLKEGILYRFHRYSLIGIQELSVHQNCHIISKYDYVKIGGYDEDFSGNYGHEDAYFDRLWRFRGNKIEVINFKIIDQSKYETKGLNRDSSINKIIRRKKMRYWHIKGNYFGRAIIKIPSILNFLISVKIIINGEPGKKIRFNWKKIER